MLGHLGRRPPAPYGYDRGMATGTFDLQAWALIGAQQRLREIDEERRAILAAFPQLRSGGASQRGASSGENVADGAGRETRRRKRRMSADARRRISEAQKARWAKQRARTRKASSK